MKRYYISPQQAAEKAAEARKRGHVNPALWQPDALTWNNMGLDERAKWLSAFNRIFADLEAKGLAGRKIDVD